MRLFFCVVTSLYPGIARFALAVLNRCPRVSKGNQLRLLDGVIFRLSGTGSLFPADKVAEDSDGGPLETPR